MSRATCVGAVVVAAGDGTRLPGPVPKPLLPLGRRTMLEEALAAFETCDRVGSIAVVVGAAHIDMARALVPSKVTAVVAGGRTRRASVAAGLEALPKVEWIVVHDGARPFVTPALIERVLEAAAVHGAATAGLPVTDTLKEVQEEQIRRTVPRDGIYTVQTPQAFRADLLRQAHERVPADAPVTDDAGLVEHLGRPVVVVPGDPANVKITTPADYELVLRHIAPRPALTARVGVGYDIHRLVPDRPLILGGVRIPSPRGLAGHSDADVLIHAIMDAMLGAAGMRDIGHHFPPSDPTYRDADSVSLLAQIAGRLRASGWAVGNVDAVVYLEAPRIAPFVEAMRDRIASTLGIPPGQVGIKATTAEGLGAIGRHEGIAAQAVALLERTD